jgi:hypothetical protein
MLPIAETPEPAAIEDDSDAPDQPEDTEDPYAHWMPRAEPTDAPQSGSGASFSCTVEVLELGADSLRGHGESTVSAAEADDRARADACAQAGLPVDRCDESSFLVVQHGARFSSVMRNGAAEQRYEKDLALRAVQRRRQETATSSDSAVSACVAARELACGAMFGSPSCPRSTTSMRLVR